jgi:2-oxo-4-hydroxy-4-carboxy-5-ureidoimidazoline decarboxylase
MTDTLARGNEAYERRFGFIFLVCAAGKSAGEMLDALNSRLRNSPDEEIRVAAEEQRKITALRLQKLVTA